LGLRLAHEHDRRFVTETGLAARIAELIEAPIEDLGYRLVRVQVQGAADQTVQVMAERPDGSMTVDDCETVSRQISPLLDVHDPIAGGYRLEVSSPGIDRPLVRPSDLEAWSGHEARVELREPVDGRRRFRGSLEGFADNELRLEVDLGNDGVQVLGLPLGLVSEVRLILTDALVEESLKRSKTGGGVGDGSQPPDGTEIEGPDVARLAQGEDQGDSQGQAKGEGRTNGRQKSSRSA